MDLNEATTAELIERAKQLEHYEAVSARWAPPQRLEDETFGGDADPEWGWNNLSDIDRELIRRAKQEEAL